MVTPEETKKNLSVKWKITAKWKPPSSANLHCFLERDVFYCFIEIEKENLGFQSKNLVMATTRWIGESRGDFLGFFFEVKRETFTYYEIGRIGNLQ